MWDTIAIIVLLGGLEFLLWYWERNRQIKAELEDAVQQQKQLEVLDGILTEMILKNSEDVEPKVLDTGA